MQRLQGQLTAPPLLVQPDVLELLHEKKASAAPELGSDHRVFPTEASSEAHPSWHRGDRASDHRRGRRGQEGQGRREYQPDGG